MELNPTIIKRLAFIKYLFKVANEQSESPEPFCGASILTYHDAIELFLQLASEHLNTGSSKPNLLDYWDYLSKKLPNGTEITQKESIRRLNKARVALKHHGTLPSKLGIESFRATAKSFFDENTPIVFDLQFKDISMTEYVHPPKRKKQFKRC